MSSVLEKLYPAVKKDSAAEPSTQLPGKTVKSSGKKTSEIYPPLSGEELTLEYIKDKKPSKKLIIQYLRNKVETILAEEDSD